MADSAQHGRSLWLWWWALGYMALMGVVVWSLYEARGWARTTFSTPESTADWDEWRADVQADQDRPVPVQRRVPKSAEPPALVLTRDYFAVLLVGAVLFSSMLYWVLAWFITGILTAPPVSDPAHPAAGRPRN